MSIKNQIHKSMQATANVLATAPETKDRYDKATDSGKEWFFFSRWVKRNMARWNNHETTETQSRRDFEKYRDFLF